MTKLRSAWASHSPLATAEMVASAPSDEELMERTQRGDEYAFRALFVRYGGRIFGYLLHRTGSSAHAEDLSQETWLRIFRGRHTYQPGARFAPWLYTIASNLRRDDVRTRYRQPEDLTSDGLLPASSAEERGSQGGALEDERAETLRQALQELPESYREVIVLHRWHDLDLAEVAQVLGTSEGAVKVRAHRGYKRLRELLRNRGLL